MNNEQIPSENRDYSTISPSAKWLLLLKALTNIPFARAAATLMVYPESYLPDFKSKDADLWARVLHFESRYRSIDQLLPDTCNKNILELSSGFSFRGLAAVMESDVHYIDTDLEDVIALKQKFIDELQKDQPAPKGKLETLALNVLDEKHFIALTNRFHEGAVTIVNEGLLMYLDITEKKKLCQIIRKILQQRGGYWITADIYVKKKEDGGFNIGDKLKQFFDQHQIEENKFESFEAAEDFFKSQGFAIDKRAITDYSKSTALHYLLQTARPEQLANSRRIGKVNETWRLKLGNFS
jgi:O-methyltransferase involved in polyketide biosynthesis